MPETRIACCRAVLTLTVLLLAGSKTALLTQVDRPASEPQRPAYQDRRFDEDWSSLRDADLSGRAHAWDRLKFIPLGDGEHVWLTLAGQLRGRTEYFNQFDFGASAPAQSDEYSLSRVRLSADLHAGRYFRVFLEGKSSLITGRDLTGGNSASFVDSLDLQNGFADVVIPLGRPEATLTVRGGRQELLFGAQRLVGPSDWTNTRRTFQGVSGSVTAGGWHLTPFWTELVIVDPHKFDQGSPDRTLYGVYATDRRANGMSADVYWLGVHNASTNVNGSSGREQRQTIGSRLWRNAESAVTDYDVEAAAQVGTLGGHDVRAWMVSANVGHTLTSIAKARPFLTVDFASGDDAPGGRVGTFNQLYPANHTFLGNIDYIGRQNILSPSGGLALRPMSRLSVVISQFLFWRASVHDAIYDSAGAVLRPGTGTTARYVGTETDLIATYQFDRHVLGYASYNHFFSGDFIRDTGPARSSDYIYGALQFTF